jgi:hypothetical protein
MSGADIYYFMIDMAAHKVFETCRVAKHTSFDY